MCTYHSRPAFQATCTTMAVALLTMMILVSILWTSVAGPLLGAEKVHLAPKGTVVAYGQNGDYTFPAPRDYQSVRLQVSMRMDSPQCAGSAHVLRIKLNGKTVNGAVDRSNARLLNKPLTGKTARGVDLPWVQGGVWRVVYAPDFQIVDSPKAGSNHLPGVSAYRLVLDVTDMVQRGQDNKLHLEYLAGTMNLRRYFPQTNPSLDLVLEELALDFSQEPALGSSGRPEEKFHADRLMAQPPATVDVARAVSVQPGGGLKIDLPGMPVTLVSRFSYQGGGFNVLSPDGPAQGQPEWKVSVARTGQEATVNAAAKEYRLRRRIRFAGDHLEVTDRLTNLTAETIGLAFDNQLVGSAGAILDAWLGGNPDPAVTTVDKLENSSVFVAGRESGCGLLAVDDVYRIQSVLYYKQGAGARSETFALGPNDTYELKWNLYPVRRPDYYDFINLARRDLGVNFTVPGGFQFGLGAPNDEQYRRIAHERGLKFMSSGVWSDPGAKTRYYHGEHMLQATALQQRLRERCQVIRRVLPDVKTLIYIHAFINLDPAGPQKHPDARITNEDGRQYEHAGYTKTCGLPCLYYYPALNPENSYFQAMKRVIDMCLDKDKIGADGIYWDELDWISTKYTFDRWDGHSALLDDQHRVKRKMAYVHLVSMAAKVKLIEYIRGKGGLLIGNSVATSDTLSRLHFPRFVETAAGWYPARAHLYSPISLGDHLTVKDFPGLLDDIRAKLMWGSLYYYYSTPKQPYATITQRMFPFTPVELHRGWLLGKERIITAVPGTFTFGDNEPVRVFWYDAAGKLTDRRGQERVEGSRRLVRLALEDKEMAVIEKAGAIK